MVYSHSCSFTLMSNLDSHSWWDMDLGYHVRLDQRLISAWQRWDKYVPCTWVMSNYSTVGVVR